MIKKLKTKDIKKGMYVILPDKWFSHPFLKIESQLQISKMTKVGIKEVSVNISKSHQEKKTTSKEEINQYLLNVTSNDYSTYVHSVNVGVLGISITKMNTNKLTEECRTIVLHHRERNDGSALLLS